MTLFEFESKFFNRPHIAQPTMLYVFTDEESAYNWTECKYFGGTDHDYELAFVLSSDMVANNYLQEKWCKAEVQQFYAVEPDVMVIVVEKSEERYGEICKRTRQSLYQGSYGR